MSKQKQIVIIKEHDAISRIADLEGNSVIIESKNGDVTGGHAFLKHSKTSNCSLTVEQLDQLKYDLMMPISLQWKSMDVTSDKSQASYLGPAHVIANVCTKDAKLTQR